MSFAIRATTATQQMPGESYNCLDPFFRLIEQDPVLAVNFLKRFLEQNPNNQEAKLYQALLLHFGNDRRLQHIGFNELRQNRLAYQVSIDFPKALIFDNLRLLYDASVLNTSRARLFWAQKYEEKYNALKFSPYLDTMTFILENCEGEVALNLLRFCQSEKLKSTSTLEVIPPQLPEFVQSGGILRAGTTFESIPDLVSVTETRPDPEWIPQSRGSVVTRTRRVQTRALAAGSSQVAAERTRRAQGLMDFVRSPTQPSVAATQKTKRKRVLD